MQPVLKSLLQQASPAELVEVQQLVSTLLRGHSGANPNKVKLRVRRTAQSQSTPQSLYITEEFLSKALARIFYEVFNWQVPADTIRLHSKFAEVAFGVKAAFDKLSIPSDVNYLVLEEACRIILRKQEASPTDLSSYKVLDKLTGIGELLTRAHPACTAIPGYFNCLKKPIVVDNKN